MYTRSTYKDNPFLQEEYIKALEEMYTQNPAKARIYCDGCWGVDAEGLVIRNWREEEFDPMELASKGLEHRAGMDLGWIDKSAIIDSLYDRENKTIYVFNEFYKSGCQLSELATAIFNMNLQKTKIYVDAAEPRSIQFFKQEGIRAEACAKGILAKNAIKPVPTIAPKIRNGIIILLFALYYVCIDDAFDVIICFNPTSSLSIFITPIYLGSLLYV